VSFVQQCAAGREVFCLAWLTAMSYLRMATHPSIFERPLTPAQAVGNIEALLSLPHCRAIGEEADHLRVYRDITQALPARGNLVPEAHLAAVLSQHGVVTLYTHDRDFRKFTFLDVRDPLV
jgi:uncharacterized protein